MKRFWLACLGSMLLGCGGKGDALFDGTDPSTLTDAAATEAASDVAPDTLTEVGLGADGSAEADSDPGPSILVTYQDAAVTVYLTPYAVDYWDPAAFEHKQMAKMSDLWTASGIPVDRTKLLFIFESIDGSTQATMPGCTAPIFGEGLAGSFLDQGGVTLTERNLVWSTTCGLSSCFGVKNLAKLNALDPPKDAGSD